MRARKARPGLAFRWPARARTSARGGSMAGMTSRERLLAAINHAPVDHVPFLFNLFDLPQSALPAQLRHCDQAERVARFVAAGFDDTLALGAPSRMHPEARTRTWKEQPAGEPYPLL